MTGLVTGKEFDITVVARFKAKSKDRLEWATMVELMQMMEKMGECSELNRGTRIKKVAIRKCNVLFSSMKCMTLLPGQESK